MKRLYMSFAAMLLCVAAFAQGEDALPFTQIERDPAVSATAGASVGSPAATAYSAFRNAALLSERVKGGLDAAASFQLWAPSGPKSTNLNAGISYNVNPRFGLALGFVSQSGASYDRLDDNGEIVGKYTPKDMLLALGLGFGLTEKLSLGVNARYATQTLAPDTDFNGISADLNLRFKANEKLDVTAGVSSLGTQIESATREKFSQPASVYAAAAYRTDIAPEQNLAAYLQTSYYLSGNYAAAIGAQYAWKSMLFARAGYRLASQDAVIPSHLALGLGAQFYGVRIDLSYLTASKAIGNSLAIGLGYSF